MKAKITFHEPNLWFNIEVEGERGESTHYQGIATLHHSSGRRFFALSEYWNGVLPTETVMEFSIPSDLEQEKSEMGEPSPNQ